ncbi:hypothetical protein RRG08_051675 [Elysia crispata]|uniref:Uncharacterized protein n=1 Tax=Elysia crispata TaxID=231223 RepID=A0AAE1AFX6_9GAST|nr:hypothetical protein RRG08_051675 [Elysia crispata]
MVPLVARCQYHQTSREWFHSWLGVNTTRRLENGTGVTYNVHVTCTVLESGRLNTSALVYWELQGQEFKRHLSFKIIIAPQLGCTPRLSLRHSWGAHQDYHCATVGVHTKIIIAPQLGCTPRLSCQLCSLEINGFCHRWIGKDYDQMALVKTLKLIFSWNVSEPVFLSSDVIRVSLALACLVLENFIA